MTFHTGYLGEEVFIGFRESQHQVSFKPLYDYEHFVKTKLFT